ncbi:gliding motility protein GldM [Nonlabens spongiae]|uniref:Gliding motility protein GldM n=1 Tax=Nonlabens spongiae TaxID=331648 RepID=A0A1W6MNC4_9FLAO|nr:gliding motility protein GldM [Nonlabens spongiae]ARN79016.1 gliding motility protein GldM [Nonlabens spongiae]
MAGGDSPRQRMINLMYLVFIAMLALNMSKEVLNAFGLLNVNIEESNEAATVKNQNAMAGLAQLASEQPAKYKPLQQKAEQVDKISKDYYAYLDGIKSELEGTVEDPEDYAVMDKGDYLDQEFFRGDGYTDRGQEFLNRMTSYRDNMLSVVGNNTALKNELNEKFTPAPEEDRDGNEVEYLKYHYQGFPLIASVAKITLLQSQVKNTETEVLSDLLQGQMEKEVSMDNYTTLMEQPKSAYFNGEKFDGEIVLGRKDATLKPNRVELKLDGRALSENQYSIEAGRIKLDVGAGNPGEHEITGALYFEEGGEEKEVVVNQSFATIPKPDSATISADKMNVVYQAVDNPMTISFAGIPDNNVTASAPGLNKVSGNKYTVKPRGGKELVINVTGKLPDGGTVTDSKSFRIKSLPRPTGMVSGQYENVKKTRSSLGISTISAEFLDFDFNLKPQVTSFLFQVPGKPSITVNGNKLDARAKGLLAQARRGDLVQIANIKAIVPGVNIKSTSSVTIEITD